MAAVFESVLIAFLQIVQGLGGSSAAAETIAKIVDALLKLIPVLIDVAPKLIATVKQIIAILEANDATLPDQIAALKAQIPADDAAFDQAADQAEANDAAAAASEPST